MSKKAQFALFSPQAGLNWKALLDRTKLCEKLGFHSIWLVDHMWTGQMPDLDHVECRTAMSGLAAPPRSRNARPTHRTRLLRHASTAPR